MATAMYWTLLPSIGTGHQAEHVTGPPAKNVE